LQLVKRVAQSLAEGNKSVEHRYLVYGEYRNASGHASTEEDFKLAEWRSSTLMTGVCAECYDGRD